MAEKDIEHNDENTFAKEALQCEIGLKLQQAREAKGLSPEHILKELKFSMSFLAALESGNWEQMPGKVYTLGFLRQYAALLNVDISAETERIKSDTYELTTPLTYPDAPISPNRIWAIGAALIFVLIIIVINLTDNSDKLQAKPELEKTTPATQLEEKKNLEFSNNNEALTLLETPEEPLNSESLPATQSPIEEEMPEDVVVLQKNTYSFYAATDDVWLQVYEKSEGLEPALLREVLLKKGQSFSIVNTDAKLLLTAGNAKALEILVDDKVLFTAGALGEQGKVLKRFPINP